METISGSKQEKNHGQLHIMVSKMVILYCQKLFKVIIKEVDLGQVILMLAQKVFLQFTVRQILKLLLIILVQYNEKVKIKMNKLISKI
jgi:hypothetical protein